MVIFLLLLHKWASIFSHCVHLKLGHRFHAQLKGCSDCDDTVPLIDGGEYLSKFCSCTCKWSIQHEHTPSLLFDFYVVRFLCCSTSTNPHVYRTYMYCAYMLSCNCFILISKLWILWSILLYNTIKIIAAIQAVQYTSWYHKSEHRGYLVRSQENLCIYSHIRKP